jgi:ribosomal protein S12 methylthiotransferase accessory factor
MAAGAVEPRARPLSATLARARLFAREAGVTRLADLTGLDRVGVSVFQAVRPLARSLTVSQGKGLTPMAAMVSALLESVETYVAETLPPSPASRIQPDRAWRQRWHIPSVEDADRALPGEDLSTGLPDFLPWHSVSMDFSMPRPPGRLPTTVGLATGNTIGEATCAALCELIETEVNRRWHRLPDPAKARTRIDPDTIDDPVLHALLGRIARAGLDIALFHTSGDFGIAGFACIITERDRLASFAPAFGSGCHAARAVAASRAVLEALQVRVTMIAASRDDIDPRVYRPRGNPLSFPGGRLAWSRLPDAAARCAAADQERLLGAMAREGMCGAIVRSRLAERHGLAIVKVMASGFGRERESASATPMPALPEPRSSGGNEILFHVGPSWPEARSEGRIVVRPPVAGGDLARLRGALPAAVAIVDGYFETVASVWHKEIVDLLALGVPVFGAASMGALRAAELHPLGMQGKGAIFEAYRDGSVNRDDAVMVVQMPDELGNRPLSLSLIDAEAAIHAAGMEEDTRRRLLRIARTLNFRDRTWASIAARFEARHGRALDGSLVKALERSPSAKRRDAILLFDWLKTIVLQPGAPGPALPETIFYRNMVARLHA